MNIYFTDDEYLELLKKGRTLLDSMSDKDIECDDCTITGMKDTTSNAGLCNDAGLCTEKRFAMFPKQFKQGRHDLKYFGKKHKCPLDDRENVDHSNGCFYHCLLFNDKVTTIAAIKELYDKTIKEVNQHGK